MGTTQGNDPRNFTEVRSRLEQIVTEVRSRDLSLEKSLDLYEEAIRLGNLCSDLVDKTDFSAEEIAALEFDRSVDEGTALEEEGISEGGSENTEDQVDSLDEDQEGMEKDD